MAAFVALPPRPVHVATGARDPRATFHVVAIRSVDPDAATVLSRADVFGELHDVERHAALVLAAMRARHGAGVSVQVLNAAGWPVGGA